MYTTIRRDRTRSQTQAQSRRRQCTNSQFQHRTSDTYSCNTDNVYPPQGENSDSERQLYAFPPDPPDPIQASPLAFVAPAVGGCVKVRAIVLGSRRGVRIVVVVVGCLAAALAGAGGGEVLEDEGVGHCCWFY